MNKANDSKFVTRKWNIVGAESNTNCNLGNEFVYKAKVLKSNFWDHNHAFILLRGNIAIAWDNGDEVAFRRCNPFIKRITKINGTSLDDAEDLQLVMAMYNLIKYNSNHSDTTGFIPKKKQLNLMLILKTIMLSNLSSIKLN